MGTVGDRAACSNLQGLPDVQQHSLTPVLPAGSVRDGRSLSASPSPSVRSGRRVTEEQVETGRVRRPASSEQ